MSRIYLKILATYIAELEDLTEESFSSGRAFKVHALHTSPRETLHYCQ